MLKKKKEKSLVYVLKNNDYFELHFEVYYIFIAQKLSISENIVKQGSNNRGEIKDFAKFWPIFLKIKSFLE